MVRRRFAHGSSTDAQRIRAAAASTLDAHARVREAAARVVARLDEISLGIPIEVIHDEAMIDAIEAAQRRVADRRHN
jgi:hypothetical protein